MITIRPDTEAGTVLALIVQSPGELDADAIGHILWPAPKRQGPPLFWPGGSRAGEVYKAWLASIQGQRQQSEHWRSRKAEKASRFIGRLQEAGLVEPMRPPALSEWWLNLVVDMGKEAALGRLAALERACADDVETSEAEETQEVKERHEQLLALIAKVEKGPRSTSDLLGASPSGAQKLAYKRLVMLGILVPPSYRWPTKAGRDFLSKVGSQ
jgi:hypothetical protein